MIDADCPADLLARLEEAIKLAGGPTAVARKLGITVRAPHNWRRTGRCPAERAKDLARLSGLTVQYIRPDLFEACGRAA